ncbi:MAG TPA: class I SAM-dependent methyltransferase [Candidatus Dojkabacteria bacterium]|nr:class I SAM-dependent methyltransferase [Candidatus Dojkabacteria bacterium]
MSTDVRTIKSYDDYAKRWSSNIDEGRTISHICLEKPAMYKKVPVLKGKKVLCIGCGSGEECEFLKERGADKVIGIDISEGLINIAKKKYPEIEFHVMDVENMKFEKDSFDYVYSSLTMHYLSNWIVALKAIRKILKKRGIFLFSTHHPVRFGAQKDSKTDEYQFILGYSKNKKTKSCEIYGDYLNTRMVRSVWSNSLEVFYYHRPLSSIIRDIIKAKFTIIDFHEPKATELAKQKDIAFWKIHQKIPLFMIFELRK